MSYRNPLHGLDGNGEPADQEEPDGYGAVPAPPVYTRDVDTHWYGDGCPEHPARNVGAPVPVDPPPPVSDAQMVALARRFADNVNMIYHVSGPPPPVNVADPRAEAMRAATGHQCPACPTIVRDLYACAHNAAAALRLTLDDDPAPGAGHDRASRKLAELEQALTRMRDVVDAHFHALQAWERP